MDGVAYKKYILLSVVYGGAVSSLYLFGYWGSFDINVLDFVGFQELARFALYPFLGALVSLLAGFLISAILIGDSLPPGGGATSRIGRFGHKHWRVLVALHLLLTVLVATFGPEPGKWFVVAFLVSLLSVPLSHFEYFITFFPNPRARGIVLFLLLFVGGFALAYGKLEAQWVKVGYGRQFVDVARSELILKCDVQKPVVYLGYMSEYFVLYESATGSVIFIKLKDNAPLILRSNPKRN